MTRTSGRGYAVGIALEAVRMTASAPQTGVANLEIGHKLKVETIRNESNMGVIDKNSGMERVRTYAEGNGKMKIQDKTIGYFMTMLLGSLPTSVQRASSGVYDHTYARLNTNAHQSGTIALKDLNEDVRFPGAMIDSADFEFNQDEWATVDFNFMSKKPASASNTITFADENEMAGRHVTVKHASSLAGLDAASVETNIKSAKVSVNKNLEPIWTIGTDEPVDFINTSLEVEGEIEYYRDTTSIALRDTLLANPPTPKALRISAKNTDVDLGSTHNPEMRIDLAKIYYEDPDEDRDPDGPVMMTLKFAGHFSVADAQTIAARVTNTKVSYVTV